MEIKINNGKFYALEAGAEKFVTDSEQEAIGKFKELFKSGKLTVDMEEVKVWKWTPKPKARMARRAGRLARCPGSGS
jgi:hypothetical protein